MEIKKFFILFLITFWGFLGNEALAESEGKIDPNCHFAWGENIGWVNFGCKSCNVLISDSKIVGYAWNENYGWINLNPKNAGVKNDGKGNLSGFAWGENLGWIDFSQVKIDKEGKFTGQAQSDFGKITFDCKNCCVKTNWTPEIQKPSVYFPPSQRRILPKIEIEKIKEIIKKPIVILKPKPKPKPEIPSPTLPPPLEKEVFVKIPLVFQGKWRLLSYSKSNFPFLKFTLAPLAKELQRVLEKFPEVQDFFGKVGIQKISNISKILPIRLTLPTLTQKFALPKTEPLEKVPFEIKEKIPSEFLFVRTGKEKIEIPVKLEVTEKGEVELKIQSISNTNLQLFVKPEKPVKGIKGYLVFKGPLTYTQTTKIFSLNNLVFAASPVSERKLLLTEFVFEDKDGDGIFEAEIQTPSVPGEYEIITVFDFEEPAIERKEIRLIAVFDPEGYVFERYKDKELRIPGAIVTLYWLNPKTQKYEIWPAKEFGQENPQITDTTGKYAFLVPEGYYYLKVEAPGYLSFEGKPFYLKEGSSIHYNIELKSKHWYLKYFDWRTVLLILILFLIAINFYRDRIREKRLRQLIKIKL